MLQRVSSSVVVLVVLSMAPSEALHGLRAKAVTVGWPHRLPASKFGSVSATGEQAKRIPLPYDDDIEAVRNLAGQNKTFCVLGVSAPMIKNCVRWSGNICCGIVTQSPIYVREVAWHTREAMRCALGRITAFVEIYSSRLPMR